MIDVVKVIKLSEHRTQPNFDFLADQAYLLTDWICEDYPQHFQHYYHKYLPSLELGTREILLCMDDNQPVGVAILKDDGEEKKISTLFVSQSHRGKGISRLLLEESFKWLKTTKPVITISDYKLSQFEKIIKDYDWKLTETLPIGYYNSKHAELVFNSEKAP